jgi:hypothetical protein
MHDILDHFVASHDGVRELDETTRRELKTIEFLKNKASQMQNQAGGPRRIPVDAILNGDSTTEHPAHLLLGLQNPSRPTSGISLSTTSTAVRTPQSPTFHRLQQQHAAPEDFAMSPTSATPSADDDAQHLLDNWCNTLSNGLPLDGVGASMGWSGWPGASEASGWVGMAPMLGANPKQQLPVISGDDSKLQHWEALVSQIYRGP